MSSLSRHLAYIFQSGNKKSRYFFKIQCIFRKFILKNKSHSSKRSCFSLNNSQTIQLLPQLIYLINLLIIQLINHYMNYSIILLILAFAVLAATQTPPVFPEQYQVDFDETAKFLSSGTTKGTIYYDSKNNRQVITRENGKFDRYCGSVYKTSNTPCNHIVVEDKRFLDFPAQNYCCFCCDSTHGCGIVSRDWIVKAGGKYNGTEQIDSAGPYIKWEIKGGQENYYYNKNDTLQTPRRLNQVPEDLMDFKNYKVGPIDDKIFALPSYCTAKCGALTICAGLRGEM